jgi:hypothetical protein
MSKRIPKRVALALGAVLATGALTGTAAAVLTGDSGGAEIRVDKRQETSLRQMSSTAWQDLPGANVRVSVPANTSRLYDVPFFAESRCFGPQGGLCNVRIIATNLTTGGSVELKPQSGVDYGFDTDIPGGLDDYYEGHGMERSHRLPGGSNGTVYAIRVQWRVANPTSIFQLDDWHLAVHTNV